MNAPDRAFPFDEAIATAAEKIEAKVIAWRRDLHQNPELGNREFRTSKLLAAHLRSLPGIEVQEKIAHTGVIGVLKGGQPGPVVALRADIDALPVKELVDVPFKSQVTTEWNGAQCGVMHACGHDAHTSILMGVAEILSGMRDKIPGTVKFIFQPAEEGAPDEEEGGAQLMIKEAALKNPDVQAIFGLHVTSNHHTGQVGYRVGPMMASSDKFKVFVKGVQTHGAQPWRGVDPIVTSAQIVMGLQQIVSRKMDIAKEPSVVTVGSIHGGNRDNIIPDDVSMEGTIRTFDEQQRDSIHEHVKRISEMIAAAGGAKASVSIKRGYDVTVNHPALTEWAIPTLGRIAGEKNVGVVDKVCGAEDFSFFQKEVPGLFYRLGCTPATTAINDSAPGHSPRFYLDENCLKLGVKLQCALTLDWLSANQ
ncbi:N-acetylcysteine deacetylase [Usitatibacter rugosus]|uniref:N-acetylcysteine deacetylase n=1 Tax=Usitatibacter rugosus TaxID=2732067 RepID=A0A6M4GT94_9PROT|nr:amidohydrolase [Usitatibacter rugosus]QJR09513.1 N-acetylcysteine deacetylase [Usitatibacter rugosus]